MSTTRRSRLRKIGVMSLVSGLTMGVAVTTGTPAVADVTAVQGDATALSIGGTDVVPGVTGMATFPTTGYGPIGSGELPSGVDCATGIIPTLPGLPGGVLLSLGLLEACTRGGNVGTHQGFAESQARVVDLQLGTADLGIITSSCVASGDGAVGDTTIIGSPVLPENPAPGQVVPVPIIPPILGIGGLTVDVVLNEQIVTNTPGVADITVNALRVNLLGIEIIVGQVHCRATGPDVNVTTTVAPTTTSTTTTLPGATTTTTSTTTTLPGATTTTTSTTTSSTTTTTTLPGATTTTVAGGGGNNNNNTNNNDNNNTSNNTNNNSTSNDNSNSNTNNQTQTNSQTQTGGDNSNTNENVINISNMASSFDDFHRWGRFSNDTDGHGGPGGGGTHHAQALARAGSESGRLAGVALLLLIVGAVLILGTRTVAVEGAAVPGSRSRRRELRGRLASLFAASRRWR